MFRGREVFHPELGKKILDRIAEQVDGTARIESEARLDGKNMVMVLAPDKRARQADAARAQNEVKGDPAGPPQGAPAESPGAPAPLPATAPAPAEAVAVAGTEVSVPAVDAGNGPEAGETTATEE